MHSLVACFKESSHQLLTVLANFLVIVKFLCVKRGVCAFFFIYRLNSIVHSKLMAGYIVIYIQYVYCRPTMLQVSQIEPCCNEILRYKQLLRLYNLVQKADHQRCAELGRHCFCCIQFYISFFMHSCVLGYSLYRYICTSLLAAKLFDNICYIVKQEIFACTFISRNSLIF